MSPKKGCTYNYHSNRRSDPFNVSLTQVACKLSYGPEVLLHGESEVHEQVHVHCRGLSRTYLNIKLTRLAYN